MTRNERRYRKARAARLCGRCRRRPAELGMSRCGPCRDVRAAGVPRREPYVCSVCDGEGHNAARHRGEGEPR
jgi:hypothetical protein